MSPNHYLSESQHCMRELFHCSFLFYLLLNPFGLLEPCSIQEKSFTGHALLDFKDIIQSDWGRIIDNQKSGRLQKKQSVWRFHIQAC